MASFRRRLGRWRAEVVKAGVRESATFDTKAEAKAWAAERESSLANAQARSKLGTWTVADALNRFAEEVSPNRRGASWERLRCKLLARDTHLAPRQLRALTASDIASWRDRRLKVVKPGSVLREWNLLRTVLETARREWQWMRLQPMTDVRRPPAPRHRDRRVSDDEAELVCMALGWTGGKPTNASQRVAVMFRVAIETAMRAGELAGLTWDRLDLKARYADLPMTKSGKRRQVPLSTEAVRLLKLLPTDTPSVFNVPGPSRDALFRKAVKRTKLVDLHFHDARHEAVWRLSKRLDVMELARVTGHGDLKSLLAYYNPTASELAAKLG